MTAHTIKDYIAYGTHAARPTPSLGANEIALYYETDTLHMFAWTGAAWVQIDSAGGGPAIVQQKATTGSGSITLGSAPVSGNLLVALTADPGTSESPQTGWTRLAFNVASVDGVGIFWKRAGAGESTTQSPTTATPSGMCMFEISNASPGNFQQNVDLSGTAIAATITANKTSSNLIIGMACNRNAAVAPTSITGATLLGVVAQGSSRTVQMFKVTTPASGVNTVTANYASSQGAVIPMIEIS